MIKRNVHFKRIPDKDQFVKDWREHRDFCVPLIESALDGTLEFKDSTLYDFPDRPDEFIGDSYYLEREDYDRLWSTKEGEKVKGDLDGRWGGRWTVWRETLLPKGAIVLAGVEPPVVLAYGHRTVHRPAFPQIAANLLRGREGIWQVELYLPRGEGKEFDGITLVTLANQMVWGDLRDNLGAQIEEEIERNSTFMGVLWTPELPDLNHPNYERAFSQTQRGVRRDTLASVMTASGDGSET